MNEAAAREVTLLQAFETVQPPSASWSDDDRAWANRVALEAAGTAAAPEDFIAQRARHALQRLVPRERAAARWLAQPLWRASAVAGLAVIAFVLGLLADSIGTGQRINLLAPPLWAVLAWNAVVYLALAASAVVGVVHSLGRGIARGPGRGATVETDGGTARAAEHGSGHRTERGGDPLARTPATAGPVKRALHALAGAAASAPGGGPGSAAWLRYATLWAGRSAAIASARTGVAFHAAAAALALGLIAGLYARGVVLDYRAAWQSTFLSVPAAHALVTGGLTPAATLSGIALPDAAGFAALRAASSDTAAGAPAAPWLHLFALTLALFVVLPRTVLALAGALRAQWLARRIVLPLADDYYARLVRLQRGGAAEVHVRPYAHTPSPQAVLGLRALLAEAFGAKLGLQIAPAVAFGAEDDALVPLPGSASHAAAWFELSATPENEHHVRFAQRVAAHAEAGASVLVLIDETAFKRRFQAAPERLAQRRDAWRQACDRLGTLPVFADFEPLDARAALPGLEAALQRPVRLDVSADHTVPEP